MKLLIALSVFLPLVASANPKAWLKQANPEELAYFVGNDNCLISEYDASDIVELIFFRNGIKPLSSARWIDKPLYLAIRMYCLDGPPTKIPYFITIYFGDASADGVSDRGKQILYDWNYGGAGYFSINSPDDWEDNLKKWVEGAIKEYAEANGLSRKQ